MHGLNIYEIKRICHRVYLFIISYGSFKRLTNFLNRCKNKTSHTYRAKIQPASIIANDLKSFRKCASLFVIPSFDKIQHDIFWQFDTLTKRLRHLTTMRVSSITTNGHSSRDSLGKITWVRYEFLTHAELSDILICCAR